MNISDSKPKDVTENDENRESEDDFEFLKQTASISQVAIREVELNINNDNKVHDISTAEFKKKAELRKSIKTPRERTQARQNYSADKFEFERSKDYLEQLRTEVPLNELYQLIDTCLNNQNLAFAPVLLRVDSSILEQENALNFPYLLQVWSQSGFLLFERKLRQPLEKGQWAINSETLIFREDSQSNYIFALKLHQDEPAELFKITLPFAELLNTAEGEDPSEAVFGFTEGHLLMTIGQKIFYADISKMFDDKNKDFSTFEHKIDKSQLKQIDVAQNFKPLAFRQVSSDAKDDQLAVVIEDRLTHELVFLRVKFVQTAWNATEIRLRNISNGKSLEEEVNESTSSGIADWFSLTGLDSNDHAYNLSVVLRENGFTDFYYNFTLTKRERTKKIERIAFDFTFLYLRGEEDGKSGIYKIKHSWNAMVGLTVADFQPDKHFDLKDVKFESTFDNRVAKHIWLWQSQVRFENVFLIAHRNFVSAYDVINKQWNHFKYDDSVRYLGQAISSKKDEKKGNERGATFTYREKYEIAVFVGANEIHFLSFPDKKSPIEKSQVKPIKTDGVIRRMMRDEEKFHGVSFLVANKQPKKIYENDKDCNCFNSLRWLEGIKESKFSLWYIIQGKVWPLLDQTKGDKQAEELLSDNCTFFEYLDFWYQKEYPKNKKISWYKLPAVDDSPHVGVGGGDSHLPTRYRKMFGLFNPKTQLFRSFQIKFEHTLKKKNEDFECDFQGCQLNKDPDYNMDLSEFTTTTTRLKGLYKILIVKQAWLNQFVLATDDKLLVFAADQTLMYQFTGFKNKSLKQADDFYLYAFKGDEYRISLIDSSKNEELIQTEFQKSGLYLIRLEELLKGKFESYQLQSALALNRSFLQFSGFNRNLCFIQSGSCAMCIPYVHRNTIDFRGIQQKSDYLIWREKSSFFSAMDKNGEIATWSIATGESLYKLKASSIGQNFKDYNVYQANSKDNSYHRDDQNYNHKSISLIVSNNPLTEETFDKSRQEVLTCNKTNEDKISLDPKPINRYKFFLLEMFCHLDCSALKNTKEFEVQKQQITQYQRDEEVRVALEFDFDILENLSRDQASLCNWNEIQKPTQHLYVSADQQKLLEVVNRQKANIYVAEDQERMEGEHRKVKWRLKHVIDQFPDLLQGEATVNFLFSKDFNYYFSFDFTNNQLVINESATQTPFLVIPNDILNFDNEEGNKRKKNIQELGKSISFYFGETEEWIRIINKDGIHCLFSFTKTGVKTIAFERMSNFELMSEINRVHNLVEATKITKTAVLPRLMRIQQRYKQEYSHNYVTKAKSHETAVAETSINYVDYSHVNWNATNAQFMGELSFTILNWKIIEKALSKSRFTVMDMATYPKLELLNCIFPDKQTVLHRLCKEKNPRTSDIMAQSVGHLFEIANSPDASHLSHEFSKVTQFEVPFMLNKDGCTPIELALGLTSIFKPEQDSGQNFMDRHLASLYLKHLSNQPFLNHSRLILRSIISCIRCEVDGIGDYLDSRFQRLICMPSEVQFELKGDVTEEFNGDIEYGVVSTAPIITGQSVKNQVYEDNGSYNQYHNYFFDLPFLHQHTPEGVEFMDALDENSDVMLFSHKSVQLICKYQWANWGPAIYYLKMLPYAILLITFLIWNNLILSHSHLDYGIVDENGNIIADDKAVRFRRADIALCIILIVDSTFFMLTEFENMFTKPYDYFFVEYIANITDVVPLIMVYVTTIWSLSNPGLLPKGFWIVQALTSIMILLKFVWFLRSQEYFAYLIRSLVEAMKDIRAFFVILIITCIGFADAFHSFSRSLKEDGFVENFYQSFRFVWLAITGFGSAFESTAVFGDILWFIATIYLVIILLNVLIAIAGESLGRAMENIEEQALKAKVSLLSELMNHPLVKLKAKFKKTGKGQNQDNLLFVSVKGDLKNDQDKH